MTATENMDPKRELLRHLVATVAFRCRVAVEGSPDDFGDFRTVASARSPVEILAHIGDLMVGSNYLMKGEFVELVSKPLPWDDEIDRVFAAIRELDAFLVTDEPLAFPVEKFVQGPIGDALTHVGQIVLLRRLAGAPIQPEPYFAAEIFPGEF